MIYPQGYGLMQPGDRQRRLTDKEILDSDISFLVPRERWKYLHPAPRHFAFDPLFDQIERFEKIKKPFLLPVMTGEDCNPPWIDALKLSWGGTFARPEHTMACPWAPNLLEAYDELMAALGSRLNGHPLLAGVWITGPTAASSQEMHTNGIEKAWWTPGQKGTTEIVWNATGMKAAWIQATEIVNQHFSKHCGILSISGQKVVQVYLNDVIDNVKEIFDKQSIFQHNSLGKQTNVKAVHHAKLLALHRQGYRVQAEMVQPGHTAGIAKFPEAKAIILYPGDQLVKNLPKRPV